VLPVSLTCRKIYRCTGYRPILDACKSFAGDVDVEDLGLSGFRKDPSTPPELPPYDSSKDPPFPEFLLQETGLFSGRGEASLWLSAGSLEQLFELMAEHKGKEIKLVVGNTSRGYYKDERPQVRSKLFDSLQNLKQFDAVWQRGLVLTACQRTFLDGTGPPGCDKSFLFVHPIFLMADDSSTSNLWRLPFTRVRITWGSRPLYS
jgi:hypothetical protein